MPPSHHSHGGHRHRGGVGFGPVYVTGPLYCDPTYPDCLVSELGADETFFADLHSRMGADWLPTFVTPTDAQNYINQTDAQWSQANTEVAASAASEETKAAWNIDLSSWQQFRDDNLKNVGWLNTKAVMDQTDRWVERLQGWRTTLGKAGVKTVTPNPSDPGQGSQSDKPVFTPYLVGAGVAIAAVAAIAIVSKPIR